MNNSTSLTLTPCIVQNYLSGSVLMLGYMNQEAYDKTTQSGYITFYSRSRNKLWTKGETSGNYLKLKKISLDCDSDTYLAMAEPLGPTCHKGSPSCFINSHPEIQFLSELESIIESRRSESTEKSYTARLFEEGLARMSQKVGEEGLEVSLAAVQRNHEELKSESADLLFHLLVLLRSQNLSLFDVIEVLKSRHNKSTSE